MKFKDASAIQDACQSIRLATLPVTNNRAKINAQFDGQAPWTEEERRANKIFTNANWLEASRIANNARLQHNNAFVKPGVFFHATYDGAGPTYLKQKWSQQTTKNLNRLLKRQAGVKSYFETTGAQTVLHAIAPGVWANRYDPIIKAIGVDDLYVPAGTYSDLSNLGFFAIYREWTYPELYQMANGEPVDPGWNKEAVNKILHSLAESSLQPVWSGNRWLSPEKMEKDWKENSGWYLASSAPKVFCWDFYFKSDREEEDGNLTVERRIVLDCYQTQGADAIAQDDANQFLYDSSKKDGVYAPDLSQILHIQFGSCSNVAPRRYYSEKGMGYLLYMVSLWQDRLRCRYNDALFESLLTFFKNVGEDDRERLESINLVNMGIMPDGVSIVPPGERNQINPDLVLLGLSQNRQLMQESSSSYLSPQQVGDTRKTPATATEEMIKLNASAALTSAMLNNAYESIEPMWRETFRRFCIPESTHPLVQKFRAMQIADGIPLEILNDPDAWEIQPNRVLGGGNSTMEVMQADRLMAIRGLLNPSAQQIVTKMYVLANSNADMADLLVPEQPPVSTNTSVTADLAMGTLMDALPFTPPQEINPIEYVERLLQQMGIVVQQLQALAQVPNSETEIGVKLGGLQNAMLHTQEFIPAIAQMGPDGQQRAKAYEDTLKQMAAVVKPFVQMIEEKAAQNAQQNGLSAEEIQKLQFKQAEFEQKMQIDSAKAQQKMEHKDASFSAELQRRNAKTAADIQEQGLQAQANRAEQDLKAEGEIVNQAKKTDAEIAMNLAKEASKPREKTQLK